MTRTLLDTNVLFASASARDEYHTPALAILRGVDEGDLPNAAVTNYVVAETLNLVGERIGTDVAEELFDRLTEGAHFEVVHATRSDFRTARGLFGRYHGLSFVDATLVAYARREGVDFLYSFDDDFDAVDDVTRLSTAVDPYG